MKAEEFEIFLKETVDDLNDPRFKNAEKIAASVYENDPELGKLFMKAVAVVEEIRAYLESKKI